MMKSTERVLMHYQDSILDPLAAKHPVLRYMNEAIYIIESLDFVKIGYSGNPAKRDDTIIAYNPHASLICYIPGTKDFEAYLHKAFQRSLYRNEWFRLTPFVVDALSELTELGAQYTKENMHKWDRWKLVNCSPVIHEREAA